jgi:uncharacterized protein (TIGR00296 family)
MDALVPACNEHVMFAFDAILSALHDKTPPPPSFEEASTALFVTWKIIKGNSDHLQLRGCIGVLEERPLTKALHDYALTSAFRDSRFSPISLIEVPLLQCTVSLISCFEAGLSWDSWEVGVHGIIIEFFDSQKRFSATFLPEVAHEQGWSREETIEALVRKSGYTGRVDLEVKKAIKLTRYKSSTCTMSYNEYQSARGL